MTGLLDREFIFVTGKGGVGKTTVAAAIALETAARGRRTILCEVGDRQRLARSFGVAEPPTGGEVELRPGLAATSIEPNAVLRRWLEGQLGSRTLVSILTRTPVFVYFVAAVPGAREIITLAQAWNLAQPRRWGTDDPGFDTVVVDAPASGHAIGMLRTPRTFGDIARVGTVRRQADRVRSLIADADRAGYVVVATPEEMPVSEALDLERRLVDEVGTRPSAIVVNALSPRRFSAREIEQLEHVAAERSSGPLGASLGVASAQGRRALVQQAQLARLRREARSPVLTLPQLLDAELGPDELERLGRELARKLDARSPALG